jgi:hypothetical protein
MTKYDFSRCLPADFPPPVVLHVSAFLNDEIETRDLEPPFWLLVGCKKPEAALALELRPGAADQLLEITRIRSWQFVEGMRPPFRLSITDQKDFTNPEFDPRCSIARVIEVGAPREQVH